MIFFRPSDSFQLNSTHTPCRSGGLNLRESHAERKKLNLPISFLCSEPLCVGSIFLALSLTSCVASGKLFNLSVLTLGCEDNNGNQSH